MTSNPKISIVTACLNSAKTIRNTIESVLNQTYDNYEYIIKDGGSKDDTIAIAKEYEAAFGGKLRIVQQKDKCMYEAMNQGISMCTGDIIGIINSDDYYSPDTLANVAEIYEAADTELLVVIGDMERVSETGELIHRYHFTQKMVDNKSCFGHPSMFAAKAVYDKIGLYDTSYRLAADGDWQYRAMEDEDVKVMLCPKVFNHMREGGASDMPKYKWLWFKERSRMQLEHNRGSKAKIYCQEFWKVIKTDIKAIIPEKLKNKAYKMRYSGHEIETSNSNSDAEATTETDRIKVAQKKLLLPLYVIMAFFLFGFIWYFIGPINYLQRSTDGVFALIVYVSLFFAAFYFGYKYRLKSNKLTTKGSSCKPKVLKILRITIWLNLVFTILNAMQYTYTTNIFDLLKGFFTAIIDPGNAYFSKIVAMQKTSTSYSVLTYITVFFAPVLFPTQIMSFFYIKDLKMRHKVVVTVTMFFEFCRWVTLGTNKGLLDIAILFFAVIVIKVLQLSMKKATEEELKKRKRYTIIAVGVIVSFVLVFAYFLVSRSAAYPDGMFTTFPYNLTPKFLRAPMYKLTSYLCQGYRGLQYILANLSWKPTWGIGNSVFEMNVFRRLTGIDVTPLTYQDRICEMGLVSTGAFQTAFAYFANDVSFPGVIALMFAAGYFFCSVLKEAIFEEDPISMTLVYMMILAILNVSCLNYMLSYSNMCVGFWGLFVLRIIRKKCNIKFL